MYITTDNYSRYAEPRTGIQLESFLDPTTRCHFAAVHIADDAENADKVRDVFGKLRGFVLVSDEDFNERMKRRPQAPTIEQPQTGDALTDQAAHVYSVEELSALKMPELKPIADRYGLKSIGLSKEPVVQSILEAQAAAQITQASQSTAEAKQAGLGEGEAALLNAPPAPPSSQE